MALCCIDLKFKLKRNRQTCLVTPALLCPRHFSTLTHAQCQCSRDVRLSIMMTVVRPCSVRDAAGQSQHCSVARRVRGGGGPESASLNSLSGTGIIVFWVSLDALYFSRGLCACRYGGGGEWLLGYPFDHCPRTSPTDPSTSPCPLLLPVMPSLTLCPLTVARGLL